MISIRNLLHNLLKSFLVQIVCLPIILTAQAPVDSLFQEARKAAFELKENQQAINLCLKALELQPESAHIRVFLGRIYAWEKDYSKADVELQNVLENYPTHLEAILALADVFLWSNNYIQLKSIKIHILRPRWVFPFHRSIPYKTNFPQNPDNIAVYAFYNYHISLRTMSFQTPPIIIPM